MNPEEIFIGDCKIHSGWDQKYKSGLITPEFLLDQGWKNEEISSFLPMSTMYS